MTRCTKCGAIDSVLHCLADGEEWHECNSCNGIDCFNTVNEEDYYEQLELDARYQAWKDEK